MSLLFFALVLGVIVLVAYMLLVLLGRLWAIPRRLRSWQGQRRREAARSELSAGLLHFAEGEYHTAEQELVSSARRSDSPLVNYLTAAIAAQRRGAGEMRDSYLTTAESTGADANLPVQLLQAQLQAESGQWEEAQASVAAILDKEPKHRRALELMAACCRALGDWERLEPLLPRMERQGILPRQELQELNRWVARERLAQAAQEGPEALPRAWHDLSRNLRKDPDVIGAYADALITQGSAETAEELLHKQLLKAWDPDLLRRYAQVPAADRAAYERRLTYVEEWLKGHDDDPQALYAAGVLALQAGHWDRARSYLEATVDRSSRPEYLRTLAALQEHQGDYEGARATYRLAMDMSVSDEEGLPEALSLPGPGAEPSGESDTADPSLEHWEDDGLQAEEDGRQRRPEE